MIWGRNLYLPHLSELGNLEAVESSEQSQPRSIDINLWGSFSQSLFCPLFCSLCPCDINLFRTFHCIGQEDYFFAIGHEKTTTGGEGRCFFIFPGDLDDSGFEARYKGSMIDQDAEITLSPWCVHGLDRLTESHLFQGYNIKSELSLFHLLNSICNPRSEI
jgi:hypothetical protein